MEESNLINNDNTYNTDMSTSQSTIGGNATTNNKFNKDDLQEVTGGGGGGIVTPPTTIVDGSETSQQTGTLTPILLILGDGTSIDEEPVLLEEDGDTTYKAVINQTYESDIPIITFKSEASSKCDANYVIAVTESDKNTPIIYDSQNLSTTFTNDGNSWCSVEFKKPLEVTFDPDLGLNADNFPDNSKIIVPVISCEENNTGQERNTVITFNIGNFSILHNIKLSVTQKQKESVVVPEKKLTPCLVILTAYGSAPIFISNSEPLYIRAKTDTLNQNGQKESYIYNSAKDSHSENLIYFAMKDTNNSIFDNLNIIKDDNNNNAVDISKYNITTDDNNYKIRLSKYNNIWGKLGTASLLIYNFTKIEETQTGTKNIKLYFNGSYLRDITVLTDKIKPTTTTKYLYAVHSKAFNDQLTEDGVAFSLFTGNCPDTINMTSIYQFMIFSNIMDTSKKYVFFHYTNPVTEFGSNLKVSNIMQHLTYSAGNNILSSYGNYMYMTLPTTANTYENKTIGTKTVSLNDTVYIYKCKSNTYTKIATINFGNLVAIGHLGKYSYTQTS